MKPFSKMEKIISIEKARRILGKNSSSLSDDQIIDTINFLTLLAKEKLCYSGSNKGARSLNEYAKK